MSAFNLSRPVLVLDAGYQPVNVVNLKRAVTLICTGKAVVLQADENEQLHAEKLILQCPRVIRLLVAIAHKVYRFFRVRLNKRNIMARDGWSCQYCGTRERPLTIDHIIPKSRFPVGRNGKVDTWENCVTACVDCNIRKGSRTPTEAGMALLKKPVRPRWNLNLIAKRRWGEGEVAIWRPYLTGRR
jgi:5-methylcytosine-specific restriction endonuclease McrA